MPFIYAPTILFLGNVNKATSILHKAHTLNAKPAELLDMAIHNLKAGEKRLLPTSEEDPPTGRDHCMGQNLNMLLNLN